MTETVEHKPPQKRPFNGDDVPLKQGENGGDAHTAVPGKMANNAPSKPTG